MVDPTEAAATSASAFKKACSQAGGLGPSQVSEMLRTLPGNLKGLSNTAQETYFETLASYVETLEFEEDSPGASDGTIALDKDVARRMNMAADTELSNEQATLLLTRGLLFLILIDQLVWAVWKNIAPTSSIKRETQGSPSLPTILRKYLTSEGEVSQSDLIDTVEKTRQLASGLLGALGPIGRNYGTKAAGKYNPESIKELVGKEGGKGETKYWQKFEELFQDLNEDVIEQDIHRAIVKYTENLLRGSRR